MDQPTGPDSPRCVATASGGERPFKHTQWSADGTCLISTSVTSKIQTFVVPADLLDEGEDESEETADGRGRRRILPLTSYGTIPSPEPVKAVTAYPGFNLQDHASSLVLSSLREHPIRLNWALSGSNDSNGSSLAASYPLINDTTEAYISPHSLTFNVTGSCFVAGCDSAIAVFDLSRPGQAPLTFSPTGPRRNRRRRDGSWNPTTSMTGLVSALAVDHSSGILAAGTFTRSVALYGGGGQGACIGAFCVQGNDADAGGGGGGAGITQLHWSPCGRYLFVAERRSDGVMVYDIRRTGQLLSWAVGRRATSNQRMGVDVTSSSSHGGGGGGLELWAGGVDGHVRTWRDLHLAEGPVQPCASRQPAFHRHAVTSAVMHRAGGVLATTGAPDYHDHDKRDDTVDPPLKIWTV